MRPPIDRARVVDLLTGHRDALVARFGVRSLSLFGSVARDEATDASDVDLLVDFARPTGLFGLLRLQDELSRLLGRSVDITTRPGLKPELRARILPECIDVF